MTWVLCLLVPMVHIPRGRGGATFVKVLAQSEYGQFCHFGICGPDWDYHHAEWHGDLWEPRAWKSLLDPWSMAYGMADPISKPESRYTIRSTPNFGSFRAAKMTPFWDPDFTPPPVWSIGGPISLCPQGAWTKFQLVPSDMSPRSWLLSCGPLALPWPGKPRVGMTPILVILA